MKMKSTFKKLLNHYGIHTKEQFYAEIGMGLVSLDNVDEALQTKSENRFVKFWNLTFSSDKKEEKIDKKKTFLLTEDSKQSNYKLATCCNPIPGDSVVGFVSEEEQIIIHRKTCPEAIKLMSSRGEDIVQATWNKFKVLSYLTHLYVRGFDRQGMANQITNIISNEYGINMRSINLDAHDGIFEGHLYLYIHNTDNLNTLISKLLKLKGIDSVTRMDN